MTTAARYRTTTHTKHGTAGDMGHKDIPYALHDRLLARLDVCAVSAG
jgi:hypothetical protein